MTSPPRRPPIPHVSSLCRPYATPLAMSSTRQPSCPCPVQRVQTTLLSSSVIRPSKKRKKKATGRLQKAQDDGPLPRLPRARASEMTLGLHSKERKKWRWARLWLHRPPNLHLVLRTQRNGSRVPPLPPSPARVRQAACKRQPTPQSSTNHAASRDADKVTLTKDEKKD